MLTYFSSGSENIPKNLASRMVFIFMLLLSVFLLTSYSAIIVSLIQTTSSSIRTLTDLMQSSMKLSMNDKLVNVSLSVTLSKMLEQQYIGNEITLLLSVLTRAASKVKYW
jgi:predicted PurR-regulated permease PerM